MAKYDFKLPDIGEGVVEGEVVTWHVSVGDSVSEDDPIVDVMTDKATVTIPSPTDGTVLSLNGDVGDMVAVGSVLIEFDTDGTSIATSNDAKEAETEVSEEEKPIEEKKLPAKIPEKIKVQPPEIPKPIETLAPEIPVSSSKTCLLYTSPSPRDSSKSRMPSSA